MKIYLAATGEFYRGFPPPGKPDTPFSQIRVKATRILLSYNGKENFGSALAANVIQRTSPAEVCMDSGAHIWLSQYHKTGVRPPVDAVEKWLYAFSGMVEKFKPPCPLDFIVELDLQRIYGADVVGAWRRDVWQPLEKRTGTRVCYVWHTPDEAKGWNAMLDNPSMSFLGMPVRGETDYARRGEMVYRAYQAGKPVHGFAAVQARWMRTVPFYSVDSTSWASSAYFGTVPTFDATRGTMRPVPTGRSALQANKTNTIARLLATTAGRISVQNAAGKHEDRDYSKLHQSAADAYLQAEQWLTTYWRARGIDWEARLARVAAT